MKNKKSIIALLIVAIIGIVGLTLAYFSNSDTIENQFITKEYGSTYTEEFVSPDNWLPGDTTNKTVVVENTGEVDEAVRISYTESWTTHNNGTLNGWIHPDGTKSTHTTETELSTDESVAIINFFNENDWTKVGDYYYYNYKLAPGESTTSLLESVTFNPKTKLDDTCETTIDGSTKTVTCNSSGDDYDNATYKLTLTIETVQYNKYAAAWNTSYNIKDISIYDNFNINGLPVNSYASTYTDETKGNMFAFNHSSTDQTSALTDYRYIGDTPKNYVKFNCDNDGTNCETWRIVGVFEIDDGTGKVEKRIKLVRGNGFDNEIAWNSNNINDWENASLKTFLNVDYYNRSGDAATYGLKDSARSMIGNAKFYLGGRSYNQTTHFGTSRDMYVWERGTTVIADRPTEWTGKVGLMYPSDQYMVYANGVDNLCYKDPNQCFNGTPSNGWIYNSNVKQGENNPHVTWFLSPHSTWNDGVFYSYTTGFLRVGTDGQVATYKLLCRPVVYLKSNIKIADGTGEEGTPYTLEAIQ